jgi:hypothetical protein
MKLCKKCNKEVPCKLWLDGKCHNLQRRKFCLECSPFKSHNTRNLNVPKDKNKFLKFSRYRRKLKLRLIEYKGGKCSRCGYDKSIPRAYSFHHRVMSEKKFELSNYACGWKKLIAEADKCDLLCVLCHAEVHHELEQKK